MSLRIAELLAENQLTSISDSALQVSAHTPHIIGSETSSDALTNAVRSCAMEEAQMVVGSHGSMVIGGQTFLPEQVIGGQTFLPEKGFKRTRIVGGIDESELVQLIRGVVQEDLRLIGAKLESYGRSFAALEVQLQTKANQSNVEEDFCQFGANLEKYGRSVAALEMQLKAKANMSYVQESITALHETTSLHAAKLEESNIALEALSVSVSAKKEVAALLLEQRGDFESRLTNLTERLQATFDDIDVRISSLYTRVEERMIGGTPQRRNSASLELGNLDETARIGKVQMASLSKKFGCDGIPPSSPEVFVSTMSAAPYINSNNVSCLFQESPTAPQYFKSVEVVDTRPTFLETRSERVETTPTFLEVGYSSPVPTVEFQQVVGSPAPQRSGLFQNRTLSRMSSGSTNTTTYPTSNFEVMTASPIATQPFEVVGPIAGFSSAKLQGTARAPGILSAGTYGSPVPQLQRASSTPSLGSGAMATSPPPSITSPPAVAKSGSFLSKGFNIFGKGNSGKGNSASIFRDFKGKGSPLSGRTPGSFTPGRP